MPRALTRYVCQQCGHSTPRWVGRCPDCGEWNSLVEELKPVAPKSAPASRAALGGRSAQSPVPVTAVPRQEGVRLSARIRELDRVLGGGIVPGSVVLVGGDPGIGKSTLLTQVAYGLASADEGRSPVLYVSGEESPRQIRLRAERLGALADAFLLVGETELDAILGHMQSVEAALVVVDSIQTTFDPQLESAPGTVSQVRHCASMLAQAAREAGTPVFLIGHVTKEGALAGPRVLEHLVDTVLYFEGDRRHSYRILRAVKNRFGSTDEIGLFEMREEGLVEVENASAALLAERTLHASGSAVTAAIEGSRALLVEVQALVARSFLANPRRTTTGLDLNRLNMLLAVLEKRVGLRLGDQDVYVNVAGGLRIVEPAVDLAVALAVASNFREEPVDPELAAFGEIGLGGEVRAVGHADRRLREAGRMGFRRALVPHSGLSRLPKDLGIELIGVRTVLDAMKAALAPAPR
jgi:DNA repair protein RadA/Sms